MATFTKKGSAVNENASVVSETRIITAEGYRRAHGRGIKTKGAANRPPGSRSSKK